MPVLTKGSFTINLGLATIGGELAEIDRQCAWELYAELSTRVAVTGKLNDPECADFGGELYIESSESLYKFFLSAREIMKRFPVGKITSQNHLGVMISRILSYVLRPFLEKWQVHYRHWWENQSNPRLFPLNRQSKFPELQEFLADWSSIRWLMRQLQGDLVVKYKLVDVVNPLQKKPALRHRPPADHFKTARGSMGTAISSKFDAARWLGRGLWTTQHRFAASLGMKKRSRRGILESRAKKNKTRALI